MYPYGLIYGKRKTLALYIDKNGQLEVRAPFHVSKEDTDLFVASKSDWIEKRLKKIPEQALLSGQTELLYLGNAFPIEWGADRTEFTGQTFRLYSDNADFLQSLYKQLAMRYLPVRTRRLAMLSGFCFSRVRVNTASSQWGSCSGKNVLSFSARLMMAPPEVIDYVIFHELAHTVHHNHSQSFWKALSIWTNDIPAKKNKLKEIWRQTPWWI